MGQDLVSSAGPDQGGSRKRHTLTLADKSHKSADKKKKIRYHIRYTCDNKAAQWQKRPDSGTEVDLPPPPNNEGRLTAPFPIKN